MKRGKRRNAKKGGAEGAPQPEVNAKVVMEMVRGVPQFGDDQRDEATSWLEEGRDRLKGHLVLAWHYHMRGAEVGTPDYFSIRDNEADDGSYVLRGHIVIDERTMQEAEPRCLAQLPLAAQAVQHAVQAVALAPHGGAAMFALERAMEGLVDAGGTLPAITASRRNASRAAPGRSVGVRGCRGHTEGSGYQSSGRRSEPGRGHLPLFPSSSYESART